MIFILTITLILLHQKMLNSENTALILHGNIHQDYPQKIFKGSAGAFIPDNAMEGHQSVAFNCS
jgi:hypothetical protein